MSKRDATPEETEEQIRQQELVAPQNFNVKEKIKEAEAMGYKNEVCLKCNTVFLAYHHFLRCQETDCPMKSSNETAQKKVFEVGKRNRLTYEKVQLTAEQAAALDKLVRHDDVRHMKRVPIKPVINPQKTVLDHLAKLWKE